MERQAYLLHSIARLSSEQWHNVLAYFMTQADNFRAFFPDDPELAAGRDDFLRLPHISSSDWEGMQQCMQITGPLTSEAVALFLERLMPDQTPLWSFELRSGAQVLLRVEDFTKCLLITTEDDLRSLQALTIDIGLLQAVDLFPKLSPGESIVPFTHQELDDLKRKLTNRPDHEAER